MPFSVRPAEELEAEGREERLRRVMAVHFDPDDGTPFWLDRSEQLGIDPLRQVRRPEDLGLLGEMTAEDLSARPLIDYIPRRFHGRLDRFVLGQTGGTTGGGTWTAYREDEFQEAFILPFVVAAGHVGFPAGELWLYVGPSGPHIIGKVVRQLANALGSSDPFSVDFDARWAKRLPDASFGRRRYVQHVIDQAVEVIRRQPIGVLFTTPAILTHLGEAMNAAERQRIRGVHYGGMAILPEEMRTFQEDFFPKAVHLSGYGNTLFGCCLEVNTSAGRRLDYFPFGGRLYLDVVDQEGVSVAPGGTGRVRFSRLDESMLIVRMTERDQAESVLPPDDAPEGMVLPGVRDPRPVSSEVQKIAVGLY